MHSFREVNVSSVIARLYGWVYKTLRLSPLVVEHSVVVMSARLNPIGSQFVQNQWSMIFWESIKDSDTGGLSSIPIRMEYFLAFKYWYCELCVENRWGRGRNITFFFFFFFFLRGLNRQWMRGGRVGQKVLFRGSWNRVIFLPGF